MKIPVFSYQYNGHGDRLRQIADGAPTTYTLDLNAGLTQVLADGYYAPYVTSRQCNHTGRAITIAYFDELPSVAFHAPWKLGQV